MGGSGGGSAASLVRTSPPAGLSEASGVAGQKKAPATGANSPGAVVNGTQRIQMTGEAYSLFAVDALSYQTPRHMTVARCIERGELPPVADWTWLQRTGIEAYVDGNAEPHSYYRTKVTRLGHGHIAALACKVTVDPWKALWKRLFPEQALTARGEGDRERNAEDAAKRAKTKVRQLCKAIGVNSLGTLTYRQDVRDRNQVLRHWKAFIRKVRAVLPSFAYVACIEAQGRGSLHVHFGMRKLPKWVLYMDPKTLRSCRVKSWDFMRAIWLRTIKVDGMDGSFDESAKMGRGDHARVMKIASYVSKYVAKDFADDVNLNRKRYFASEVPTIRPEVRSYGEAASMADLIAGLYAEIPGELIDFQTFHQGNREFFWYSAHAAPSPGEAPG